MNEKEKDAVFSFAFSVVLLVICFIAANFILPKGCHLFSSNIPHPQACDTIGADCSDIICQNRATASVASTIAGLGICSLFLLPVVMYKLKDLRSRPIEQTKLFD